MEERRQEVRRQADRALQRRVQELEQWHGDSPTHEMRQRLRRAIRHNCTAHLSLAIRQSAGFGDTWTTEQHPIKGRVLDLSAEGCAIFLEQPLEMGQRLSLLINLRSGSKVHAQSVVRWIKAVPKRGGYACGIQFSQVQQKDQQLILIFLREIEETIGL